MRGTAVFWLLFSTSVGLGISMLVASFIKHWQNNFLVAIVSLVVTMVIYAVLNRYLEGKMVEEDVQSTDGKNANQTEKKPMLPLMLSSGLIAFLIICLLRVAIDNGIKMMTPVMLMESYKDLPASISTRLSSILIIFSALGTFVAGFMKSKITKNEAKAQLILYAVSLLPLAVVCFVGGIHYLWILVALSVAIILIHGAAPFSQSFAALHFERYGRIGTVSGILNATASIGNVLASYLFAKMAEIMPWSGVAASWLVTIVACGIICIAVLPKWTKFTQK